MDDMKLLRDFGAALEHEPPASLARQRNRLTGARPRRRRVGLLVTGLAAVATAAAVAVPTLVLRGHQTVAPPAGARPAKVTTGALNVLLVGTDSRAGSERFRNGARTDTILLVHLPADRKEITAVSIPRDSIVQIPRCGALPPRKDMINSAFNQGGLTCTVKTIETLTDVRIDHMVEVDFLAFKEVVNALGGVQVTMKQPVNDPKSKLRLPAGTSILNGEQALGYMRLRNYGDGSDMQRIKRQQVLLRAMMAKAKKTLTDPGKVSAFLGVAGKSIKADKDFDMETMVDLATSLSDSRPRFLTVPWVPSPDDPNRIVWKQPAADRLFARLR
ncbi:LCP family protein [Nonomuraea roseoviolacea]|uniref:LCP family protein required for cell wall assembly n=1 Tax=Nonomuraea roseoviolacea subsp. carminata TaxID=160689 RepID=A0ABT1JYK2_9ACTN|nr:LCP family protein [Nonomuraea roseoviolacea]MCP2346832.1 LCP family protein required for cell wall assembly [Nonomuraea roseoviolacea subsp. carminata]